MDAFLVPRASVSEQRASRLAAEAVREAERAADAARLGLPWPMPRAKKTPGRPSREQLYREALYACIRAGTLPPDLRTAQLPLTWQKGKPILGEAARLEAELVQMSDVPTPAQEGSGAGVGGPEPQTSTPSEPSAAASSVACSSGSAVPACPPAKRKKVTVDPEVKIWFLQFAQLQAQRYGWPMQQSLRHAQFLAPELFADVHPDTPRRWLPPPEQERRGRPKKLPPIALTAAAEAVLAVAARVPISAGVARAVIHEQLRALEIECSVSIAWTKEFLQHLGMSYKASAGPQDKLVDPDVLEDARRNLQEKLVWTRHEHGVPWSRVVNLDQTSIRVLPTAGRGWGALGKDARWPGDARRQVTCALCCPMAWGALDELLAQIIFNGKTAASLPSGPIPHNVRATCTANHWADTQTMQDLIAWVDSVLNKDSGGRPWVLLLDVAPIHISAEFRTMCETAFPWVKRVYVPPNLTHKLQPLDRSYMFSFKKSLARQTATHFAREIVGSLREDSTFTLTTSLVALKPMLCAWTSGALMNLTSQSGLQETAWQPLMPATGEQASILQSARRHFAEGTLFRSARRNAEVVPEYAPHAAEPAACTEDDPTVEPEGHDDLGLVDASFDQAMAEDEPPAPVEAQADVAPPNAGAPAASPVELQAEVALPPRAQAADLSTLARLTAIRLIYGRGPGR
jgi:DDE superfamily endonuclease